MQDQITLLLGKAGIPDVTFVRLGGEGYDRRGARGAKTMRLEPICCMVIAPCTEAEIDRLATQLARTYVPSADRHDWDVVKGTAHAGLLTREPGSLATDWTLAAHISKALASRPVYTLWFVSELAAVHEWREGKKVIDLPGSPAAFARSLGFEIDEVTDPPPQPQTFVPSVAVIEAPLEEVRRVLGARADEPWLRLEAGGRGTVMSADDSNLGMEHYELSVAMPDAIVYRVFRDGDEFGVQALKGGEESTSFYLPPFPSETAVPEMFGVRTREEILAKLGIAPALLGYER